MDDGRDWFRKWLVGVKMGNDIIASGNGKNRQLMFRKNLRQIDPVIKFGHKPRFPVFFDLRRRNHELSLLTDVGKNIIFFEQSLPGPIVLAFCFFTHGLTPKLQNLESPAYCQTWLCAAFFLFVVSYNHLVYLPPLGCVGVDGAFGLNNGDIIGSILFPDKVCG